MNKQAQLASVLKGLGGLGAGAGLGYLHGAKVSPYLLDYQDVPGAVRSSAAIDTAGGALLGLLAMRNPAALKELSKKITPKGVGTAAAAYGGSQLIPVINATAQRAGAAAEAQADAAREQADAAKITSIPYNLQNFLTSDIGKGLAVGGAAAGIGGILSGLLRRRTAEEEAQERSRAAMMRSDALKYLLPAMAAGGVIGSLRD